MLPPAPAWPPPVETAELAPAPAGPTSPAGRAVLPPPDSPVPPEPTRRRTRALLLLAGALSLVLAVAVGAYLHGRGPTRPPAAAVTATPTAPASPPTPYEAVQAALTAQAGALVRGDEGGWLAAVDPGQPKLLARYRSMYRSLRALGVRHFAYRPHGPTAPRPGDATTAIGADVEYCFRTDNCPGHRHNPAARVDVPPTILQDLKLKPVGGRYVITGVAGSKGAGGAQPTPWENGDLAFAQGRRVTVAGPRSQARHFKRVLALAERSAVVNDRFAALVGNPQQRYRIYLAGAKEWKTWYGGEHNTWVVGYAIPLGTAGTDVVLNMAALVDHPALLANTIQHELGHVVTLGGAYRSSGPGDMWLAEGIAEYIGWYPKPATASWSRPAVWAAVHGSRRPTSIAARALPSHASPRTSDAFYGLGHFAADCLARTYGQRALFTFARLYLREDRDLDAAARTAFGRPFGTVDKACVAWIRRHA